MLPIRGRDERVATGIEVRGPRHIVLNSDHAGGAALPLPLDEAISVEEAILRAIPLAAI